MASMFALFCFALVCALPAEASLSASTQQGAANPIRKVVTLLQAMQKKVEEEGVKEKELYDKFTCYCTSGKGDLSASISAAETKAPALGTEIEASQGKLEQAKADLAQAQADRAAAKQAIADATALREREAAAYASEKADYDANIAAIAKAVAAVEKGAAGSFLQSEDADLLRRVVAADDAGLADVDRQAVDSFLAQGSKYAPASGEVTGILKEMGDTFSKALAEATAAEEAAIKMCEELIAAKTKEINAATATVEAKTTQIGELGVLIVQLKEDLSDTEEALLEDKRFLAELDSSCATKTAEWEARSKTRAEEVVALADTIKVLNDDDALELFKKTLPSGSASLLQMQVGIAQVRATALSAIRAARLAAGRRDRAGLDLIALALAGKRALTKGGFDKVVQLIDGLVSQLKKEQQNDDDKKEYCAQQFDMADDKKKALEREVSDQEKAIATTEETIKTLAAEIAALEAGISALDKSVAEATELRKEENTEYKDLLASDTAAKEVLVFAKNRLNKFYNPKMYKAPPKKELTKGDRIYTSMGGEITTKAPGGIAGTGIAALVQVRAHAQRDAPAPPPETWGAYQSKSEDGTGVIAMIDLLIADLDKELAQGATEEKDSQADYEKLMADAADKRAADSKALTEKSGAKADAEAYLEATKTAKASSTKELLATLGYIQSMHGECDWLLKYFDTRKEARVGEVDSLTKAKAVLSGADYSLIQTQATGRLLKKAPQ